MPTPTPPPVMAAAAAAISALMAEVLSASIVTLPDVLSALLRATAWAPPRITLSATAPAPAMATPTRPPEMATDTATDSASMFASSSALMVMSPLWPDAWTTLASMIEASALLSMLLLATETPIAIAAPTMPTEAAKAAAATSALMSDWSAAATVTLSAVISERVWSLPSMVASTSVTMRFSAAAPAPLTARPRYRPPATATEPLKISASIDWSPVALTDNVVPAVTGVFSMEACTSSGASSRLTSLKLSGLP